jgi:hypothetical protein
VTHAYRKAGPTRRGHLRRASLWLGDDHVLLVTGTRFVEKYRRFYYRDIQAITIRRARRFIFPVYSSLALAVIGIVLIVGLAGHSLGLQAGGWAGLAAIALERYIAAMFRSCYTHLYTSVSAEDLPSLNKFRSAAKAVALLEQRIQQAQGAMPDGWQTASEFEAVRINPLAAEVVMPLETVPTVQTAQARWAGFAFIGLLLYAPLNYLYLLQPETRWMGGAIKLLLLLVVGLCLYGYLQLHRQRSSVTGYLLLGAIVFTGFMSYAEILVSSFAAVQNANAVLIGIPIHRPGMAYVAAVSIGGSVLLGVLGLLAWVRRQAPGTGPSNPLSLNGRT